MKALFVAVVAIGLPALFAQTANSPTIPKLDDANPEIVRLVVYDQWDRGIDMFGGRGGTATAADKIDWAVVGKRDQERCQAVRKLLADGKIQTGRDYFLSALVCQHSGEDTGFLLAHVLAVTAVAKGSAAAKWLAAASMDRYLQTLNQPQVFGTQFHQKDGGWTMEPYDRTAFSDAVRTLWCVVPLSEQEQIVRDVSQGKPLRGTGASGCK
jgi:hypothetical protein